MNDQQEVLNAVHNGSGLITNISESDNVNPDCAYMEINSIINGTGGADLLLTLNFNATTQDLPGGSVQLGLRASALRLELQNAEIPYNKREFIFEFETKYTANRKHVYSESDERTRNLSSKNATSAKLKAPEISHELTSGISNTARSDISLEDTFEKIVAQVSTAGTRTEPSWFFSVSGGNRFLLGTIINKKLAEAIMTTSPSKIVARLLARPRDIVFLETGGVWPSDLSKNKAAIARIVALRFLKNKFWPHISIVVLCHE